MRKKVHTSMHAYVFFAQCRNLSSIRLPKVTVQSSISKPSTLTFMSDGTLLNK